MVIICCLLFAFGGREAGAAWPWQAGNLATINGINYTPDDYRHWWSNWREAGMEVPEKLETFIEWKLLAAEANSMELYNEPGYRHKVNVFLKARTRILLKYDEVDSKITLSDAAIQSHYDADYAPFYYVTSIYFATAEEAAKAYEGLQNQAFTFGELLQKPVTEGGPGRSRRNIFRPKQIRNNMDLAALQDLAVGAITKPRTKKHYTFFMHLDEKKDPDRDDYSKQKNDIRKIIVKEQEAALTLALLNRLWEKYAVMVNEDLLHLAHKDLTGDVLKEAVVNTNMENIPLYLLVKDLRKEYELRKLDNLSEEVELELKNGLLNGMITEYLLTWEAAARKYEEKPPFKWSYEFYKENRLIKELERVQIASQVTVTKGDIEEYYHRNLSEFMTIGLVSYAVVKDEKDVVEKVWREVGLGQDFAIAAKKFEAEVLPVRDMPINKIVPATFRKMLQDLKVGEVTKPVAVDGKFAVAKILARQDPEPLSLDDVKEKIILDLKNEEFRRYRNDYLKKLYSQSDISINQGAWQRLRQELQEM